MTPAQLQAKLNEFLALPQESEWVEFKRNNSDPQMIDEYLSALSNSAALERQPFGYIVWGIEDGTRKTVGTSFKPRSQEGVGNEDLEPWLNKLLVPKVNFRIFEFEANGLPVVMFEVQAANTVPVAFGGRRYVRVGSHKKPLAEHPERERELWLLLSGPVQDWSAQICAEATLNDLDPKAIAFARQEYKKKHPTLAAEVDGWDDATFLNKANVCINGQITRTAIILLGKDESDHYLSPGIARISWVLKGQAWIRKRLPALRPAADSGRGSGVRQNSQLDLPLSAGRQPVPHRNHAIRPVGGPRNPAQLHRPRRLLAGWEDQRR